jgi:hypothetical protein
VSRYSTSDVKTELNAQHITAILVGLAVTWYGLSLRAKSLGGALILGWTTPVVLLLLGETYGQWRYYLGGTLGWNILVYVLLIVVVIVTVMYVRRPSGPEAVIPRDPERVTPEK